MKKLLFGVFLLTSVSALAVPFDVNTKINWNPIVVRDAFKAAGLLWNNTDDDMVMWAGYSTFQNLFESQNGYFSVADAVSACTWYCDHWENWDYMRDDERWQGRSESERVCPGVCRRFGEALVEKNNEFAKNGFFETETGIPIPKDKTALYDYVQSCVEEYRGLGDFDHILSLTKIGNLLPDVREQLEVVYNARTVMPFDGHNILPLDGIDSYDVEQLRGIGEYCAKYRSGEIESLVHSVDRDINFIQEEFSNTTDEWIVDRFTYDNLDRSVFYLKKLFADNLYNFDMNTFHCTLECNKTGTDYIVCEFGSDFHGRFTGEICSKDETKKLF